MRTIPCFLLLFLTMHVSAQYYYNDLLTTAQTNEQYLLLKKNHVQEVVAKSYEADGALTTDFLLEQKIAADASEITTTSDYPATGKTVSQSYYANNRLSRTVTNSDRVTSTVTYSYNPDGGLASIVTETVDTFMNSSGREAHLWFYQDHLPVKMLLVKNNSDTTTIELSKDEHGDIGEERWKKNGRQIEHYFYYYDDEHRLTDIVRYNAKAQRLLPDFLFDYDTAGVLVQFTQIPQGSSNYLVWHYEYNNNGLKEKESCFNKEKQLVGTIAYAYR